MLKNTKQLYIGWIISVMFLPLGAVTAENALMNHETIRTTVRDFLLDKSDALGLEDVSIEVGQIDHRLRLAQCSTEPEVLLGNNRLPGNLSVAVRCNNGKTWKIYLQATVNAYKKIYVARSPITRGSEFSNNDLVQEKHNVSTLNGNYITDPDRLKGQVAKRNIRRGEIIKPFMIVKSKLVKRGEEVTIIAETSGISVRMSGKAMNDAAAGEQVRVKNNSSKRIVEGTAVNRGIVKINM